MSGVSVYPARRGVQVTAEEEKKVYLSCVFSFLPLKVMKAVLLVLKVSVPQVKYN